MAVFTNKNGVLSVLDGRNEPDLTNFEAYYYTDSGSTYTDITTSMKNPYPEYTPAWAASDRIVLCQNDRFGKVYAKISSPASIFPPSPLYFPRC